MLFFVATMNVSLTDQLEHFVSRKVASGRYTSASEVIREALRLLEERDRLRETRVQELRRDVLDGISQLDSGLAAELDIADIKSRARRRSTSSKKK